MRSEALRPARPLRRALAAVLAGFLFGCGGGSGGGGGDPGLTPGSVDFEIDEEATRDSLQVVEIVFAPDDCAVEEGAVLASGRRRLLRFDTVVRNMGELDCRIGDPADPEPPMSPDSFAYHDCHGHYHLEGYASYELRLPDGTLAAIGHKQSFCITDSIPVVPGAPSLGYDCDFQGLSSGWADVYDRGVPGQWVDVSGVPGGDYVLVLAINPEGAILELDDRRPNRVEVDVTLPAPSQQVLLLDDHADDPAQATGMPSPAGFQAALQTAGDVDWFRVQALGGRPYAIRTVLLALGDSRLRVYAADAATLLVENDDVDPGVDLSSEVAVQVPTTQDVLIEVSGPGGSTGSYRLVVE